MLMADWWQMPSSFIIVNSVSKYFAKMLQHLMIKIYERLIVDSEQIYRVLITDWQQKDPSLLKALTRKHTVAPIDGHGGVLINKKLHTSNVKNFVKNCYWRWKMDTLWQSETQCHG